MGAEGWKWVEKNLHFLHFTALCSNILPILKVRLFALSFNLNLTHTKKSGNISINLLFWGKQPKKQLKEFVPQEW